MQSVTSTVYYLYCGHPLCLPHKTISNYAKFKTLGDSIPTKKTHLVTDIAPVQLYHTELHELFTAIQNALKKQELITQPA